MLLLSITFIHIFYFSTFILKVSINFFLTHDYPLYDIIIILLSHMDKLTYIISECFGHLWWDFVGHLESLGRPHQVTLCHYWRAWHVFIVKAVLLLAIIITCPITPPCKNKFHYKTTCTVYKYMYIHVKGFVTWNICIMHYLLNRSILCSYFLSI